MEGQEGFPLQVSLRRDFYAFCNRIPMSLLSGTFFPDKGMSQLWRTSDMPGPSCTMNAEIPSHTATTRTIPTHLSKHRGKQEQPWVRGAKSVSLRIREQNEKKWVVSSFLLGNHGPQRGRCERRLQMLSRSREAS